MPQPVPTSQHELARINKDFYESLWSGADFCEPERFNTWPLLAELCPESAQRLEIGPGLRPKLPVPNTHFIELSEIAVRELNNRGARAVVADATELPYQDNFFDIVCAFDVIEHIHDDKGVFREVSRVLRPGGCFLFSVPLHSDAWSSFDTIVGHCRRYDIADIERLLETNGLTLQSSAGFGMKPRNKLLTRAGLWFLQSFPDRAFSFYNKYLFPLGIKRQEQLKLRENTENLSSSEGAVFYCRRPTKESH